jgi:hypothetical protein
MSPTRRMSSWGRQQGIYLKWLVNKHGMGMVNMAWGFPHYFMGKKWWWATEKVAEVVPIRMYCRLGADLLKLQLPENNVLKLAKSYFNTEAFSIEKGVTIQVFRLLSIPHPPNWTRNHRHVWDDSPIPTIIKGDFSLWGRYIQYMITRVSWLNGYSYKNGSNHYSHCGYYSSL